MRLDPLWGFALTLAACAGTSGRGQRPQAPSAASSEDAARITAPARAPTAAARAPSAPPFASNAQPIPLPPNVAITPPAPVEMKPPLPTALGDELSALGLAPSRLPPIEKLDPKALRGVMKLIARSLGVKCADCHAEGDFAAPTARKRIAAHMWNEFAAKLEMEGGAPLFCDSCHQGRTQLLDRRDKKVLGGWMDEDFVVKLQRKDNQPHKCETCHVEMEMTFLSKWSAP